jgi:hypothetical protein
VLLKGGGCHDLQQVFIHPVLMCDACRSSGELVAYPRGALIASDAAPCGIFIVVSGMVSQALLNTCWCCLPGLVLHSRMTCVHGSCMSCSVCRSKQG